MSATTDAVDRLNSIADEQERIARVLEERGIPHADALATACKIKPIPKLLEQYVLRTIQYEKATHEGQHRRKRIRAYDWDRQHRHSDHHA